MLETMIALFVLAVGLLGTSALQTTSMRSSTSSYQRSQATLVAYDLMDRLRSNRNQAMAGNYNLLLTGSPATGDGAAPLADDDLEDWFTTQVALLPAGDAAVNCTAAGVCTVTIQWDDSRVDENANAQQFTFTSQI